MTGETRNWRYGNLIVDLALVKIPHSSHLTQRTAEQIQREMAIFPIKKDILII